MNKKIIKVILVYILITTISLFISYVPEAQQLQKEQEAQAKPEDPAAQKRKEEAEEAQKRLAKEKPISTKLEALENFQSRSEQKWQVIWNKKQDVPVKLYGGRMTIQNVHRNAKPQRRARQFFLNNHKLFKMPMDIRDLKLVSVAKGLGGASHVVYQQTYFGVPVYGAYTVVHLTRNGIVNMVDNRYRPKINVAHIRPFIIRADAIELSLSELGLETVIPLEKLSVNLVIYPKEQRYYLAWRLLIPAIKPRGEWLVFVDAIRGKILAAKDILPRYVDGSGLVFDPNPIVMSGNTNLRDDGIIDGEPLPNKEKDRDYPALNNLREPVVLRDLDDPVNGEYTLSGRYAKIVKDETAPLAYSTSHIKQP